MGHGLFGKLPVKRDFVAVATPRSFLEVWEPWIGSAIAASRDALGNAWLNTYLTAPIWRFWLGPGICRTTIAGAIMPSADGIGRYFPLTLVSFPDEGRVFLPPEMESQDTWFEKAEEFLLSALAEDLDFALLLKDMEALAAPSSEPIVTAWDDMYVAGDGVMAIRAENMDVGNLFSTARLRYPAGHYSNESFWWTLGGEGYDPVALAVRGLPDPWLFRDMLTGRFDNPKMSQEEALPGSE